MRDGQQQVISPWGTSAMMALPLMKIGKCDLTKRQCIYLNVYKPFNDQLYSHILKCIDYPIEQYNAHTV